MTRSTSLRSTCRIPVNTVKKISTATRMNASAILEASPMPSQITNSGARTRSRNRHASCRLRRPIDLAGEGSPEPLGQRGEGRVRAGMYGIARPRNRHGVMLGDVRARPLREQVDLVGEADRFFEIMG